MSEKSADQLLYEEFAKFKRANELAKQPPKPGDPNGHTQDALEVFRNNAISITTMALLGYDCTTHQLTEFGAACNALARTVAREVNNTASKLCKARGWMLWPDVRTEVMTVLETCLNELKKSAGSPVLADTRPAPLL